MTLTYHLKILKSLDLHGFEPTPARFFAKPELLAGRSYHWPTKPIYKVVNFDILYNNRIALLTNYL